MYDFNRPVSDAGHVTSQIGGGKAMGLEWAADNRLDGADTEGKGMIMEKVFVDVCAKDGTRPVPIEIGYLKTLEASGLVPRGTVNGLITDEGVVRLRRVGRWIGVEVFR